MSYLKMHKWNGVFETVEQQQVNPILSKRWAVIFQSAKKEQIFTESYPIRMPRDNDQRSTVEQLAELFFISQA